jgi:hypothetical protein
MNSVRVEVSDNSAWRVVESGLPDDPQWYQRAMREASRAHPGRRVRAVDSEGRVLDIL